MQPTKVETCHKTSARSNASLRRQHKHIRGSQSGRTHHCRDKRFSTITRDEREAEIQILEEKITALSEDNEHLKSHHDELARTNTTNKEQIIKLLKEKASWQDKCMQLMEKKHSDEDLEPE